ncbi:MAG TPA: xanthine dehydrogenase family protein molybdopterin-binding subunit [Ramlibacter sp.]|nr:xanthine dehydrogenase family protein molybdopterin-binding subunit [Ramlibacter sp.]
MAQPAAGLVGQPMRRVEDERLLTGQGRFAAHLQAPGQLHAAVVRSPHPHARILSIDAQPARHAPGVAAVYTAANLLADGVGPLPFKPRLVRADGSPMVAPVRQALAHERVRFVGEPVAFVLAETESQALDAAERVLVDYEPLEAVVDAEAALQPGAPSLLDDGSGNVAAHIGLGDAQAVDAAFARAAHVVPLRVRNQRLAPVSMEPRALLARFDAASSTFQLETGHQKPHELRNLLADAVFKVPPEQVRVIVRDIGGAFGAKMGVYPEEVLALYAARRLQRPVRWCATRGEAFLTDTHGRDQVADVELALDADGRFLAVRARVAANLGAYATFVGAIVPGEGAKILTTVYRIPAARVDIDVVLTHTAPVGPYRGAGRPEAVFQLERAIDAAAAQLGIDRVELRRRNLVRRADMPYRNAVGSLYDSGDFPRLLDRTLELADWDGFAGRRGASEAAGLLRGRGLAFYVDKTGSNAPQEHVRIEAAADGIVTVLSATQAMGQGLETAYTQVAADRLDLSAHWIQVLQGDTFRVQKGAAGSGGSRSLFIGGSAIALCCDDLLAQARTLAARVLEQDARELAYRGGVFLAPNGRKVSLRELAQRHGGWLVAEKTFEVDGFSWPNGCHACEVEVDPATGAVRVDRFAAVDDVGNPVNPLLVHGQIEGGIVQGIGQALLEHVAYDPDSGQLLTGSFMDYALPRADDIPHLRVELDTTSPCLTNPLGAKGAGEGGAIGAPPAVVGAVLDAIGERHLDMPLTAGKVWQALQDRRRAA